MGNAEGNTMRPAHGDLGMVSVAVIKGNAPVRMIRYSKHPDDGWWVLAESDLPIPKVDNIATICVHCTIKHLAPEIAVAMDLALADAHTNEEGVGIAVCASPGRWVAGVEALEVLDTLDIDFDDEADEGEVE